DDVDEPAVTQRNGVSRRPGGVSQVSVTGCGRAGEATSVRAGPSTVDGVIRRNTGMQGVEAKLDKAWHGKTAQELADAPVSALKGVSEGDADYLAKAF